jgi:hypothetical protein
MQADADDLGSIQAILKGLKRKYEVTGTPPILIHTVSLYPTEVAITKLD